MPSTTIPGIGVEARWAEGENGWGLGMDENLVRLSVLTQPSVPSLTATLNSTQGVQIAPPAHANAGHFAAHVGGSWWFYAPYDGMRVWVRDTQAWFVFNGTAWAREASAAHVVSPVVTASRAITESEFSVGATIPVDSENDVVLTVPGPGTASPQLGASVSRRPVTIARIGTGKVSVAAAPGSTLVSADGLYSARARYSFLVVAPMPDDLYILGGDAA